MTLAEHADATRDMAPHVETLTRLAAEAKQRVIEFGVRTGVSTWALLDGLPDYGRLWSVDIDPDCYSTTPSRVRADERWTFVAGDTADLVTRLALPPSCELVVIDASHEYHATIGELEYATTLGAGRIALHDWNLPDVADAVRGFLDRDRRYFLERIEPSEWGFVVLRRRD